MKKLSIQLEELICPMCATKIETALVKMDGVEDVKVLYNTSKAKLSYDEQKVTLDDIESTINNVGYDVISMK